MVARDTLLCCQSAVKFSTAFGSCGFNKESMRVRELVQNLELHYLAVMLQAAGLIPTKIKTSSDMFTKS